MPAATDRPRLLLLDGHSLAYRAFFALPVENFSTSTGEHTNAVYGFVSMLVNVLREEAPTHVAVAFDESRQTFRLEEYPEYKAKRAKTPQEFHGQVPLIRELLDAFSITHLTRAGFEADDIIATLSTRALDEGYEVLILTGDRDSLQLVTDHSTVLYPMRGVSELARLTPVAVEDKYGVPPARYPELAALVGEDSDNLPGVPGVGPKTAAKWLAAYDGLENLINRAEEVGGKAGQNFRDHLDDVMRNRRLNALVTDLDLGLGPADLARDEWDRREALELLDGLEFRGELRTRVLDTFGAGDEPVAEVGFELDGRVVEAGAAEAFLAGLGADPVGVAVRGTWGAGAGEVEGIAVATATGPAGYLDVAAAAPADEAAIVGWLADPTRPKVLHDANGPLLAFATRGWRIDGLVADTAILAYLLAPDQRSYALADLTLRHLKRELQTSPDNPQGQLFETGDEAAEDEMLRARAIIDLSTVLTEALADAGGADRVADIELSLLTLLVEMERVGIAVDTELLDDMEAGFADQVREAAADAYEVIGQEINLGSPKQLQVVLFDDLGMPKTKRIKTGYTTDAEALQWLFEQTEHPFLLHLLRHRDVSKMRQIVEGLRKTVAADGRIHTTFNQLIAATGRLSSTDPNLQNIPVRTEAGHRIREAFVAGPGYADLLTADYSQIEMRIMAHLSEDADLIEAFRSGLDFHRVTAARVFEVDPGNVDAEMRARIKAMNYGLAYGLSAYGLSQQLHIERAEAQALMDEYHQTFGGVSEYLAEVVDEARSTGFTETIMGRRRYLPDLTSDNRQRREMAERMALNAPIQGSAADIIKVAMLRCDEAIAKAGLSSRMLLQVHDELVFEVAAGEHEALEALVREQMAGAADLSVPLDVSVGVGPNWRTAGH